MGNFALFQLHEITERTTQPGVSVKLQRRKLRNIMELGTERSTYDKRPEADMESRGDDERLCHLRWRRISSSKTRQLDSLADLEKLPLLRRADKRRRSPAGCN